MKNETKENYQQLKHDGDQSDGCTKAPFCSCQAVCLSAERSCSILSPPQSLHLFWPSLIDANRRGRDAWATPVAYCKVALLQRTQARAVRTNSLLISILAHSKQEVISGMWRRELFFLVRSQQLVFSAQLVEESKYLLHLFLLWGGFFWLRYLYAIGRQPKETGSTFEASNINGVIECIDYIITFPSIRALTEMYSLNNWKCVHERCFISIVA